jgi:decaprenylphospho-beta-D-ribofuranose 2-oxidase
MIVTPAGIQVRSVKAFSGALTTKSYVASVKTAEDCRTVFEFSQKNGLSICPRGAGFTYGDMILNDGNLILDLSNLNDLFDWDSNTGILRAGPSVRLSEVLRITLRDGWTLNSCPGGMEVTLGGAIGNNIHGKDAWRTGNFGSQVVSVKLLKANGEIEVVSRGKDSQVFNAVIGGQGLLGVIIEVTLALSRIPSAFVQVESIVARNIYELLEMLDGVEDWDYGVGWVDTFASGKDFGRGYVVFGSWVSCDTEAEEARMVSSLTKSSRVLDIFPASVFWGIAKPFFRPTFVRQVNRITYALAKKKSGKREKKLFTEYNFPHNKIPYIEKVYMPEGFIEIQPMIPRSKGHGAVAKLLRLCKELQVESLLCGIKRHRPDEFLLSYEGDGYSVGIDLQLHGRDWKEVQRAVRKIFEYTVSVGGKIYLAKDQLLDTDIFSEMYPRVGEFKTIKSSLDPCFLFSSDMAIRLNYGGKFGRRV